MVTIDHAMNHKRDLLLQIHKFSNSITYLSLSVVYILTSNTKQNKYLWT